MRVLIFDTETTGLPKTKLVTREVTTLWPYIVQFSYLIYDVSHNSIVKIRDSIVKIPEKIEISKECTNIHGITNEMCSSSGEKLENILQNFMDDFHSCDLMVGHNLSFDLNMVKIELMRLIETSYYFEKEFYTKSLEEIQTSKKYYCTMQESIDYCDIKAMDRQGKEYVKFPKLVELHEKLFNIIPKHLHNSLNDVLVCLRCFYMLKYKKDLLSVNKEIKYLFEEMKLE